MTKTDEVKSNTYITVTSIHIDLKHRLYSLHKNEQKNNLKIFKTFALAISML